MKTVFGIAAACGLVASASAFAAPISVDGVIGAEWTGASVVSVLLDPGAQVGNFGTPTNLNHVTAYDIYMRGDSSYVYVGLSAADPVAAATVPFANLYFGYPITGSVLAFETTSNRAFRPGLPGYTNYTSASADIHVASGTGVIEFAVPFDVFTNDTLGMGFQPFTSVVSLRLSQSFGYSVAGGQLFYGDARLGTVAIPEPTALGLLAAGRPLLLRKRR